MILIANIITITFIVKFLIKVWAATSKITQNLSLLLLLAIASIYILFCGKIISNCVQDLVSFSNIPWLNNGMMSLEFTVVWDELSIIMTLLLTIITGLVMMYSSSYLNGDPSLTRFIFYLFTFFFSMILW